MLQVLGTAVGLNLLLGIPILPSVLVLALDGILFPVILPFVVRLPIHFHFVCCFTVVRLVV